MDDDGFDEGNLFFFFSLISGIPWFLLGLLIGWIIWG